MNTSIGLLIGLFISVILFIITKIWIEPWFECRNKRIKIQKDEQQQQIMAYKWRQIEIAHEQESVKCIKCSDMFSRWFTDWRTKKDTGEEGPACLKCIGGFELPKDSETKHDWIVRMNKKGKLIPLEIGLRLQYDIEIDKL